MADLTHEHQTFVVICLAQFMTPQEVADAVKEEYGVEVSRQAVRHYNPEQSKELAAPWVKLWKNERAKFIKCTAGIAISHSAFRLRELTEMYRKAKARGSTKLAAQLLEQAAKESGGSYTNQVKQEHTGKDGGPIAHKITPVDTDYRNAAAPLAPKEAASQGEQKNVPVKSAKRKPAQAKAQPKTT